MRSCSELTKYDSFNKTKDVRGIEAHLSRYNSIQGWDCSCHETRMIYEDSGDVDEKWNYLERST